MIPDETSIPTLLHNSFTVATPSSVAVIDDKVPKKLPIGVRATPQITTLGLLIVSPTGTKTSICPSKVTKILEKT